MDGRSRKEGRSTLKSLNAWQRKRRLKALEGVRKRRNLAREAELSLRRKPTEPFQDAGGSEAVMEEGGSQQATGSSGDNGGGLGIEVARADRPGFVRAKESCKRHASQLSVMEWLIDVPEDLHTHWFVMPRPEGPRCLVTSQGGSTISRFKNGRFHRKFQSALPNGSKASMTGSSKGSKCVLDAVFHAPSRTFYVTDCMVWEDYSLVDCDFEFRRFWLSQRLPGGPAGPAINGDCFGFGSSSGSCSSGDDANAVAFHVAATPVEKATRETLARAYSDAFAYEKDGLILIHKEALYIQGQQTPLCLQWKDAHCSRYPIDTDAEGNVLEKQSVVLQLAADGRSVCTGDDDPIALGALPLAFAQENAGSLRPGMLFRFNLGEGGLVLAPDGKPAGANLELVGMPKKRVAGDVVSRILFQYLTRTGQVTFQTLLAGFSSPSEPGDVDM
mmetsp:Transcript_25161/g.53955  ORF Transcript_25161/g.53955 Transcript_25161/m.53955 type:complete len:444 (+) Transcript_25161:176-1507(+)